VQKTDGVTEIPYDRWDVDEYFDPSPNAVGRILGSRALKVTLWERIPSGMLWPLFFFMGFYVFFPWDLMEI
jgi:hypothetical protein